MFDKKLSTVVLLCALVQGNLGSSEIARQSLPTDLQLPSLFIFGTPVHQDIVKEYEPKITKLTTKITLQVDLARVKITSTKDLLNEKIGEAVKSDDLDISVLRTTVKANLQRPEVKKDKAYEGCVKLQVVSANALNTKGISSCVPATLYSDLDNLRTDLLSYKSTASKIVTTCRNMNPLKDQGAEMTTCLETYITTLDSNTDAKAAEIDSVITAGIADTTTCITAGQTDVATEITKISGSCDSYKQ